MVSKENLCYARGPIKQEEERMDYVRVKSEKTKSERIRARWLNSMIDKRRIRLAFLKKFCSHYFSARFVRWLIRSVIIDRLVGLVLIPTYIKSSPLGRVKMPDITPYNSHKNNGFIGSFPRAASDMGGLIFMMSLWILHTKNLSSRLVDFPDSTCCCFPSSRSPPYLLPSIASSIEWCHRWWRHERRRTNLEPTREGRNAAGRNEDKHYLLYEYEYS